MMSRLISTWQSYRKLTDFPIAHKGLAEVYSQIGKHDEAVSEMKRHILSGRSTFILDDLGYIYARLEER